MEKIKLNIPDENIKSATISLLVEQIAISRVTLDLLSMMLASKGEGEFKEKLNDQIKLNTANIEKHSYDIAARLMNDFG